MTLGPEEALDAVRRAYKYVEHYQQRVLDSFTLIESHLPEFVPICWRSGSSWHGGRFPTQADDRLLRNLEVSWAHGQKHEAGEGTYVVVTHIVDTHASFGERRERVPQSDSIFHALVVRPRPAFDEKAFGRPDWSCVAEHFPADADLLKGLHAAGPFERTSSVGSWYIHGISLASITKPEDFSANFVEPLWS